MSGEEIIKLACKGDVSAEQFCTAWQHYAHAVDDAVDRDKPFSSDAAAATLTAFVVEVAGNPFFQAYKGLLTALIVQSANYWAESNMRNGAERDILKAQWHMVVYQVAYIKGGWQHMRDVTHRGMEFDYEPSETPKKECDICHQPVENGFSYDGLRNVKGHFNCLVRPGGLLGMT